MCAAQPLSSEAFDTQTVEERLRTTLDNQRASYLADGYPGAGIRRDRIDRAITLLVDNQDRIADALSSDFGHRSRQQTLLTDVAASIEPLKYARKRLARWMRPERRRSQFPFGLVGGRSEVQYQPLGVVGAISPWNFPVQLTFAPLAGILSAGNRAMIKPSELTPATSALLVEMVESAFDSTEITVITGGPEVGQAFSRLEFDHLLFTGATSIGKQVMLAAAENLVPVTLELGGKSPVVIGSNTNLKSAAIRIMTTKTLNAGQICLAPDYVFAPEDQIEPLIEALRAAVPKLYRQLIDNDDYTSVINQRHFERLRSYIDDARSKGARVVEINPAAEDFNDQIGHKLPPTLLVEPADDAQVMQEEIFGPLLPIKSYRDLSEVIDYINARPRPLALYYFGDNHVESEQLLQRTTSGGVTVNDVMMHIVMEDLPFGGVGASGIGCYHGHHGFKTFSHAKAVYRQAKVDLGALIRPPYGERLSRVLKTQIRA